MTDNEMRIAIAEECGWKRCRIALVTLCTGESMWADGWSHDTLCDEGDTEPPDYPNDLNACHEMEKVLTPEQEENYVSRLGAALMSDAYEGDARWVKSHLASSDSTYRATARQRSEAFLRTLGLWKDQ